MAGKNTSGGPADLWLSLSVLAALSTVICLPLAAQLVSVDGALYRGTARAMRWSQMFALVVAGFLAAARLWPKARAWLVGKPAIFLVPFAALALFVSFKWYAGVQNNIYMMALHEDGPVETAGAVAFLVGAYFSLRIALTSRGLGMPFAAAFHLLICAFMAFLGLEEISYGQRIFGFEGPEAIIAGNYQSEFNFHNQTALSWLMDVLGPDIIIYWGLLGFLAPLGLRLAKGLSPKRRFEAGLIFAPWYLASYFLPYALWANIDECCAQRTITISHDQEPAEAFLALAFLLYAWVSRRRALEMAGSVAAESAVARPQSA